MTQWNREMKNDTVTTDMFVADVLERWPQTAKIFQQFKTACVGCAMAPFDTISDVVRIYELNGQRFLEALRQAARGSGAQTSPVDPTEQ